MHLKISLFTVLVFFFALLPGKADASEAESEKQLSFNQTLAFLEYETGLSQSQGNFFRRLFGGRRESRAVRTSRSQKHKSGPGRYSPPPSSSEQPTSYGNGGTAQSSSSRRFVRNEPRGPLRPSLREQYYALGIWELGVSAGTAHPITDIGSGKGLGFSEFTDYHTSHFGVNLGLYARYRMNTWFALKLAMDYVNLSAESDQPTNGQYLEHYRFSNDVFEFAARTELMAPGLALHPLDVYAFAGVGVFFSDASVYDSNDQLTEIGVDYSQVQPVIPFGFGFSVDVLHNLKLGYEFGWRNTIFHYLDGYKDNSGSNYDHYFLNSLKIGFHF